MWAGGNLGCSASPASVHGPFLGGGNRDSWPVRPFAKEIWSLLPVLKLTKVDLKFVCALSGCIMSIKDAGQHPYRAKAEWTYI